MLRMQNLYRRLVNPRSADAQAIDKIITTAKTTSKKGGGFQTQASMWKRMTAAVCADIEGKALTEDERTELGASIESRDNIYDVCVLLDSFSKEKLGGVAISESIISEILKKLLTSEDENPAFQSSEIRQEIIGNIIREVLPAESYERIEQEIESGLAHIFSHKESGSQAAFRVINASTIAFLKKDLQGIARSVPTSVVDPQGILSAIAEIQQSLKDNPILYLKKGAVELAATSLLQAIQSTPFHNPEDLSVLANIFRDSDNPLAAEFASKIDAQQALSSQHTLS